jgi:hypothetical protein
MMTAVLGLIVRPDGSTERKIMSNTSEEIHETVEGFFDCVRLSPSLDLWVHDEGIFEKDPNPFLTILVSSIRRNDQPIFGTGIFTGGVDNEGETISLSPVTCEKLEATIRNGLLSQPDVMSETVESLWAWANDSYGRVREEPEDK